MDQDTIDASIDIPEWGCSAGLSATTMQILEDEELLHTECLRTLTREDILELKLSLGQRNMLIRGVKKLQQSQFSAIVPGTADTVLVTTTELAKNKELNDLLNGLSDMHLKDYLTQETCETGVGSGKSERRGEKAKVYLIRDFVSKPKSVTTDNETTLLANGETKLFVRSGSNSKPNADQVSLAQWISANSRILLQLMADGTADIETIKSYLQYTSQIGDFAQVYTTSSIMLLDDNHRRQIGPEKGSWNEISFHDMFYHVEKRT